VDYVTSNDHEGLKRALGKTLPHVVWQRCQTHFSRNLLDKVHKKDRQQVHAMLKYMYDAPTREKALKAAEEIMDFLKRALSRGDGDSGQCEKRYPGRLRSPGALPEEDADHEHDGADQRGDPEAGTGDPDLPERRLGTDADRGVSSETQ